MKAVMGYMTAGTKTEAKEIVMALLEEGLIACANLVDKTDSYFSWEEGIHHAKETMVFFKTRQKNVDKIVKHIKTMHSYDCPCVIFWDITGGNQAFMRWIQDVC